LEVEISLNPVVSDWLNTSSSYSTNFSISNVQLLYDAYAVDEAVQKPFFRALLANRVLSIPVMGVYSVTPSIAAGSTSFSFSAVRAFSRLSHVWLTFRGTGPRSSQFICPTAVNGNSGATPALSDGSSPSARLSIGPHMWPDPQPAASIPELFYQFQKALPGVPNITRDNFQQNCFTICFDLRKVPSDPTSSISTRSGDLLRCELLNLTPDVATECVMTLFSFNVVAVRESGVTLLS
jgi:hypothetical protein